MRCGNYLIKLLERNGPISKREAMKTLGYSRYQIENLLRIYPGKDSDIKFPG